MQIYTKNGKEYCYRYNFYFCSICFRYVAMIKGDGIGEEYFLYASDSREEAFRYAHEYADKEGKFIIVYDKNPDRRNRAFSSAFVFPNR